MPNKLTAEQFILRAVKIHGNKYDYSAVIYNGFLIKIQIICTIHGTFSQTPARHLIGVGCPKCARLKTKLIQTKSLYSFIYESNIIHNHKYSYEYVDYINGHTAIDIFCLTHNKKFSQLPSNHLAGNGCPDCAIDSRTISIEEFVNRATIIHNNKYNYDKVIYKNSSIKVKIICHKHGAFFQTPDAHINKKNGCSKCFDRTSKSEADWLNHLNLPNDNDHRQVKFNLNGKNIIVDGFDPKTNTVYEFYGDSWHGNPNIYNPEDINPITKSSYKELYNKTIEREIMLKTLGYNVVSIWGQEWFNSLKLLKK